LYCQAEYPRGTPETQWTVPDLVDTGL
jgi:hypothetical protein